MLVQNTVDIGGRGNTIPNAGRVNDDARSLLAPIQAPRAVYPDFRNPEFLSARLHVVASPLGATSGTTAARVSVRTAVRADKHVKNEEQIRIIGFDRIQLQPHPMWWRVCAGGQVQSQAPAGLAILTGDA